MNKNTIQKFAIWARNELIAQVSQRAYYYEINEKDFGDENADIINDRVLTPSGKAQRKELICQIKRKGFKQVMEEIAYTWFNRFIALRFMEVNNYLPTHTRVFSDANGDFAPEIVKEVLRINLPGLDKEKISEYIQASNTEDLYRYLLLLQCNALNESLPQMFQRIDNYTEMLLPINLLRPNSVLARLVSDIPEDDWREQVQIIGWLYQYYNTEPKQAVFDGLKKNVKITKENIPAATQLFTPDWIVRYMVENSLGKFGVRNLDLGVGNEELGIGELKKNWKYYIEEAEQTDEVKRLLLSNSQLQTRIKIEDVKTIDPCCGSGHILVCLFDVLMQMYQSAGWDQSAAASSIVKNNLYGLDIDDRAAQLAYFAVVMKARQYDRRFFARGVQPHVFSVTESNWIKDDYQGVKRTFSLTEENRATLDYLFEVFRDAGEYGSILQIQERDYAGLLTEWKQTASQTMNGTTQTLWHSDVGIAITRLIEQAVALSQKYDAVVTNPPYMGASGMNATLSDYVKKNYPDSKSDLFAVFMERCGQMTAENRYQAMITQHAWMFLSSYEKLRAKLLKKDTVNMAHLGARAFEEIGGEVVQTTSFVMRNSQIKGYKGVYCRLIEPTTQQGKEDMFLAGKNRYAATQDNFSKIPGSPVAYWVSEKMYSTFDSPVVSTVADVKSGMTTTDNNRFLRLWFEVKWNAISFTYENIEHTTDTKYKWYGFCKGGDYRKWYGNYEYIVNWYNNGQEIRKAAEGATGGRLVNVGVALDECLVWTKISSGPISFRHKSNGIFFSDAAPGVFCKRKPLKYLLGLLNSRYAQKAINIINPTLNYVPGAIASVSYIEMKTGEVSTLVEQNISISKKDWDSFETSWDFERHPLLPPKEETDKGTE